MDNEISVKQAKNGTYVVSYWMPGKKNEPSSQEIVTAQDLDELSTVIGKHFKDKKSSEEQKEYDKGAKAAMGES